MTLRAMTYNVLDGGIGREALIVKVLSTISADVVLLQEVFNDQFVRHLADSLGMHYFLAQGNSKYHLALLSRWPIAEQNSHHPFPPIQQTVLEASIECPNRQRLNVFGVHPVPRPFVALELWRLWELRIALERARRVGASACLLLGDFNATAPGDTPEISRLGTLNRISILLQGQRIYRFAIDAVLKAGFVDCFRQMQADAEGFTYGPPAPVGRIDYIFANHVLTPRLSNCFVVREHEAVDRASDHYPVVAEFVF